MVVIMKLAWTLCFAVSGGKQGLLRALMDLWTMAPIVDKTVRTADELPHSEAILRMCAATCCSMRKDYADILRVILNTAPHDREGGRNAGDGHGPLS